MQSLTLRIIPFARRTGAENMSIDEYLISYHERTKRPVVRVYGWKTPAITLGRYQDIGCINIDACLHDEIPLVRRLTGGGAIFHHQEVTYSFVCAAHDAGACVEQSYQWTNDCIKNVYHNYGLDPVFAKDRMGHSFQEMRPPFCFSGNERFDILIGSKKIGGNAQKRLKDVVFQHGSIPLEIDRELIKKYFLVAIKDDHFTCLSEATCRMIDSLETASHIIHAFKDMIGLECVMEDINAHEKEEIRRIMKDRYLDCQWNWYGSMEEHGAAKAYVGQ